MKLVIHNEGLELRGSERQIVILADGLRRRGHTVVVSCHPDGALWRELERLRIRTTGIRPRGDLDVFSAARFAAFLRRERPHAVLLTAYRRLFWSTLAARLAGDIRVVVRLGLVRALERRWKYRSAFRRVDALMVNSRGVEAVFRVSAPSFPADAVHRVRNATLPATPADPGTLRAELGLDDHTPLLLSLGSLASRKGYDLLLDSMPAVPDAHLAIAGRGPEEPALREQADRLGLTGRVHFLGLRDDVPALLAEADLFVLATRNDSLPNAMLEAMAAGVPVLVTDVGGVAEAVGATSGRPPAGWVVPGEDEPALRRGLELAVAACRGPEGRARGAEGARRAADWFSPERMVVEAEAVLFPASASPAGREAEIAAPAASAPGVSGPWRRWKQAWRKLETAPVTWRVKRAIRQCTGREPRSRVQIRVERREHGEWWVHPPAVEPGAIVYSFGVGFDLRFERAMAETYGAKVVAFDPTPWTVEWIEGQELPQGLEFRPVGVAGYDGTAWFHEPARPDGSHSIVAAPGGTGRRVAVPVRRLPTLVRELGPDRIDLLKLDVEGAEYAAIRDLADMDVPVTQVLVEFHHRFHRIGPDATREALRLMEEQGYRIFHISPAGREYSFLRPELVS